MKKILLISALIILFVFIILFSNFFSKMNNLSNSKYKIAFVISSIGDKGFADMQLNGVQKASKLYNIKHKLFLTQTFDKIKDGIQKAINEQFNIIICGNGFLAEKAILELAPLYPKTYFICMDTELSEYPPNVVTVSFKQNEGSFLAGVLAAKMTKKKTVGFIGGMNIPVINDFLAGYKQGIKYIDKDVKIEVKFMDQYSKIDPFQDIELGKKIALELIDSSNVDIIYAVAGKTNIGIYEAIKDKNILAIGVDTDQDYIVPGQILTSMIKNLDTGIIYIIDKIINNRFDNKNFRIGLKENGVALSEMKYTKNLISEDIQLLLNQLKEKIIENKMIIDSVYK